jgi:hypothetical protein
MKHTYIFTILSVLFAQVMAQSFYSPEKSYYYEIPDNAVYINNRDSIRIGGISGIEPAEETGTYFLIIDKPSPRSGFFTISLNPETDKELHFTGFREIPIMNLEGESIRIHPENNSIYISNEGDRSTNVYQFIPDKSIKKIKGLRSITKTIKYNSGIEGICFSPNGDYFYAAIERPPEFENKIPEGTVVSPVCPVFQLQIDDKKANLNTTFGYPLQRKSGGNGISEILTVNDSIIWIFERDYLKKEDRNIVGVYSVNLNKSLHLGDIPVNLHNITELLRPKPVFEFTEQLKIGNTTTAPGNIEAACFSHDGRFLILVTDNNFGNHNHTPTQIYVLRMAE